jgi:sarcosine oxidase subunit delta
MLLIECPWCGKRAQTEFTYEGDATVIRPEDGDQAAFHAYVHLRENVTQWHDEMWQHTAGCRRFFKARRNVTTHEIFATAKPKGDLPDMPSGEITS